MSTCVRKMLTLGERVAVLDKIESGKSCHSVAEEIGVGKAQIQNVMKDKDNIQKRWTAGESQQVESMYTKV